MVKYTLGIFNFAYKTSVRVVKDTLGIFNFAYKTSVLVVKDTLGIFNYTRVSLECLRPGMFYAAD